VFALQQALDRDEFPHRQLAACDGRIAPQLQTFVDRSQGELFPPSRASGGATATGQPVIRARRSIA